MPVYMCECVFTFLWIHFSTSVDRFRFIWCEIVIVSLFHRLHRSIATMCCSPCSSAHIANDLCVFVCFFHSSCLVFGTSFSLVRRIGQFYCCGIDECVCDDTECVWNVHITRMQSIWKLLPFFLTLSVCHMLSVQRRHKTPSIIHGKIASRRRHSHKNKRNSRFSCRFYYSTVNRSASRVCVFNPFDCLTTNCNLTIEPQFVLRTHSSQPKW